MFAMLGLAVAVVEPAGSLYWFSVGCSHPCHLNLLFVVKSLTRTLSSRNNQSIKLSVDEISSLAKHRVQMMLENGRC